MTAKDLLPSATILSKVTNESDVIDSDMYTAQNK